MHSAILGPTYSLPFQHSSFHLLLITHLYWSPSLLSFFLGFIVFSTVPSRLLHTFCSVKYSRIFINLSSNANNTTTITKSGKDDTKKKENSKREMDNYENYQLGFYFFLLYRDQNHNFYLQLDPCLQTTDVDWFPKALFSNSEVKK